MLLKNAGWKQLVLMLFFLVWSVCLNAYRGFVYLTKTVST